MQCIITILWFIKRLLLMCISPKKIDKADIYYNVLQVGSKHLDDGITLHALKDELKQKYLTFDSYINTIFFNNFSPIDSHVQQFGVVTNWDLHQERIDQANVNRYRINVESLSEYLKLKHFKLEIKENYK